MTPASFLRGILLGATLAAAAIGPYAPAVAQSAGLIEPGTVMEGKLSYYGRKFAGRKTASGERFNPDAMTMAHPRWPFGTQVKVTNLVNNKSVVLRVNDRGPSIADRVADVSSGAARKLDMLKAGLVPSRLEVVGMSPVRKQK